ncbi:MAG: class II aldolase/adducin family protein [Candidatus Dormibacteria bacterium]
MQDRRLADRLVEVVREMDRLGFAPGSVGNVSVRVSQGRIAVTPTGVPYKELGSEHIVIVDEDGKIIEGDLEPSSDTPVHLALYRARPGVASVLHCHPPLATTLACLGWPLPPVHYMQASLSPDGRVEVARYAMYGTDELGRNAVVAIGETRQACLLANHGVICLGDSPERALSNAVTLDWVSGVYLRARGLVTEPPELTAAQISEVALKLASYGRENQSRLRH